MTPSRSHLVPQRPRLNGTVASASWPLPHSANPSPVRIHINLLNDHWSLVGGHWSADMVRDRNIVELEPLDEPAIHRKDSRLAG